MGGEPVGDVHLLVRPPPEQATAVHRDATILDPAARTFAQTARQSVSGMKNVANRTIAIVEQAEEPQWVMQR